MQVRRPLAEAELTLEIDGALDLQLTLGPLRRGSGDPTMLLEHDGVIWRASNTPAGPATVRLVHRGARLVASAWGSGAAHALGWVPDLIGLNDEPRRLVAQDAVIADLVHRFPGLRLPRTHALFEALLPSILEQKVTNLEAWRAHRALLRQASEAAPGPVPLRLPPRAAVVAALPYFALHPLGIERRRAEVLRRAAAAAARLEDATRDEAYARLATIPGIGPWTIAEVGRITFGDPDAVSVGDYHLPSLVAWAFAGEQRADDARMLELLEPYRGQRGRVQRLLEVSGMRPSRRGPRPAPRRFART